MQSSGRMPCLSEKDDVKSLFTERALPSPTKHSCATNAIAYFAKSSVLRRGRHRQKHCASSAGTAVNVSIGMSLVLLSSWLSIPLAQSVAYAGDFSSQTVTPQRYTGVRMQQGNPQLDNDRKPSSERSHFSTSPHIGRVDMQQGKIVRDVHGVSSVSRRGVNSTIFCGANCGK
jgi:hypothetical protein